MNNNKVQTTTIGNKKVTLDPTYGIHQKLLKKWNVKEGDVLASDFLNEFCIDALWMAMKRNFVFKPFVTKSRMKKYMKPWDMDRITVMVDFVYQGNFFTEEELHDAVEKRRKEINEMRESMAEKIKTMTADELAEMIDNQEDKASDAVKKNG